MNILITGGAGFIGSHLSDYLLMHGHNITILDDLSSGKITNIQTKCKFVLGDINDIELLSKVFEGIDLCYHLAAIPSVHKSVNQWVECHKVNLTGTINIFLEAAKRGIPVVYASSAAVYGDMKSLPISENMTGNIISPYGCDKYSCELQANTFAHVKGLRSTGLRFFNVYGSRQDPSSPYSGVISIFCNNIKNNKPLNVFGDGTQERDFIFIDDLVNCLALAGQNTSDQPKIYNVCTGSGTQLNDLIRTLFKVYEKEVGVNNLAWRDGDIYRSIGDSSKAQKDLGFRAVTSLESGLKNLVSSL